MGRLNWGDAWAEIRPHLHVNGAKPDADGWITVPCFKPENHTNGDRRPSLRINLKMGGVVDMARGCIRGNMNDLAAALGVSLDLEAPTRRTNARQWTVPDLADQRHLPLDYLKAIGVTATPKGYEIPIDDPDAKTFRRFKRYPGRHGAKYWWEPKGCPAHDCLYFPAEPDPSLTAMFVAAGEPDAWTLNHVGLATFSLLGGEGTPPSEKAIAKLRERLPNLRTLYLPYDLDLAGDAGAERVGVVFLRAGFEVEIISLRDDLPEGGDVSDLWRRCNADSKTFLQAFGALARRRPGERPVLPRVTNDGDGDGLASGGDGDGGGHAAVHEHDDVVLEHRSDWGNARRLVRLHGPDIRFCTRWGKWFCWDGQRMLEDDTDQVYRHAKNAVKSIYGEAESAPDGEARKEIAIWGMKSEAQPRIEAMIIAARSEHGIPVRSEDLDADPWLLNVENVTIDLRTGEPRPHRREDLITKMAAVLFEPDAQAPVFTAFLNRIMNGNDNLITYLQRTLGRALTGDTSEHRLEIWYGPGANGKSTLINAVLGTLGDYGQIAAPGLLLTRRQDRHPTEIADLKGARFVASIEVGEDRNLAEELVKQLTGGDRLKARFMHQNFWHFAPTHKLFVACNHKPVIRGTDHAIWRRLKLVSFSAIIPDAEQDKRLDQKLTSERSGILNWLLRGCMDWQTDGITDPDEVTGATADYRADEDVLAGFIADRCITGQNDKAMAGDLYKAYVAWCTETGETIISQKAFGTHLASRGFSGGHRGQGRRKYWKGIGLGNHSTLDLDTDGNH